MATKRVTWTSDAPTTQFDGYGDLTSQSQKSNYSIITTIAKAINQGGSGSYSNFDGEQKITVGGATGSTHSGTLPAGVATGATRWSVTDTVKRVHESDGTHDVDQIKMFITGWFTDTETANMPTYTRIPKAPTKPGTPTASAVLPTSAQLTWAASTSSNGSAIDGYLVRIWEGPTATGTYVDASETLTLTRLVTGLKPGKQYTVGIYAHNNSYDGYSLVSTTVTFTTIAPIHVRVGGLWKYAVPWVKVSGVWKVSQPWVKVLGSWKQTA